MARRLVLVTETLCVWFVILREEVRPTDMAVYDAVWCPSSSTRHLQAYVCTVQYIIALWQQEEEKFVENISDDEVGEANIINILTLSAVSRLSSTQEHIQYWPHIR